MSTPTAEKNPAAPVGDPVVAAGARALASAELDLATESADKPSDTDLLTLDMMDKLSAYFKATLANSTEDYLLLAELNTLAASRYSSMTERTTAYLQFIQRVQTTRTHMVYLVPSFPRTLPAHLAHPCFDYVPGLTPLTLRMQSPSCSPIWTVSTSSRPKHCS
jgi:hypothetical protein